MALSVFLTLIKRIIRRLPLSDGQRNKLVFWVFSQTGELFSKLPSYQIYLKHRHWLSATPDFLLKEHSKTLETFTQAIPNDSSKAFLMISHGLGGGTARHVNDLATLLKAQGIGCYIFEKHDEDYARIYPVSLEDESVGDEAALPLIYQWNALADQLPAVLDALKIGHIHVHHTLELPQSFYAQFAELTAHTQLAYDVTLHDYFSICPRFTLFDEGWRGYCGEPADARACNSCVSRYGSALGREVDVADWREANTEFLQSARRVFVPDRDLSQRLVRYFPQVEFTLRPHPELAMNLLDSEDFNTPRTRAKDEVMQVVIVGGIAPHKGSKVILDCAQDALNRNLPLHFTLLGYSDIDAKLKARKNVTVKGRFESAQLHQKLSESNFHLMLLPSIIPETYNYVLTECWLAGLCAYSFDIGAPANRIRDLGWGAVLPLQWQHQPHRINDALLKHQFSPVPTDLLKQQLAQYPDILADYYQVFNR